MNLIIGNTSQFFPYFKERDEKIVGVPSRDFKLDSIGVTEYDRALLIFGEHRTFLDIPYEEYLRVNVDHTLNVINQIKHQCKTIVVFLTSELWNNHSGAVTLETPINYNYTHYVKSKDILRDRIIELREAENLNIIMVYPFNCNSPYRRGEFLFAKFIKLINTKTPIEVGDLDMVRDMPHPKLLVDACLNSNHDIIIGSGVLTNIRDFYIELLQNFDMDYNYYVTENKNIFKNYRSVFYYDTNEKYNDLIKDTVEDIKKYLNKNSNDKNNR
jgi:nucleoside-diphosphate-sugar epimerase